jgi:small-conductance mechanosensitive channel
MLDTLKENLSTINDITKTINNFSKDNSGYIVHRTITQSVHFKYEELFNKFIKLIEIAKNKINSDIVRNKSKKF